MFNHDLGPIVISLEGKTLTKQERQILKHKNVGGIILFSRNFANKLQITELITTVREINPHLLVMVDHEGGRVWRFKNNEFLNPGPMQDIGKLYNNNQEAALKLAFDCGQQIAISLLACGIDLNLAPVLDVDHNGISCVIGDRAFHDDPHIVAILAKAFINGQQSVGMQAVGKHFPGHGAIAIDTHRGIAVDTREYKEIYTRDLKAFHLLIQQDALPAIMPAHVIYDKVDSNPAGFSKIWLQDILREQLNFKGIIISDCLSMRAAQQFFLPQESNAQKLNLTITQKALQAGCDLVIFNYLHNQQLLHLLDHLHWDLPNRQISLRAQKNGVWGLQ